MKQIKSQKELDAILKEADGEMTECCVLLAGGLLRSSKDLNFDDDDNYEVLHESDGEEEVINRDEFADSWLGEAISKGAFYQY